jgi:murein DD-endopeptidase MepM/ murein hydrolase activator NlpD
LYRHKKILVAALIASSIFAASVTGYYAADRKDPAAEDIQAAAVITENASNQNDISGIQALNQSLTKDEQLCETIEKINLKSQLESEKEKTEELNDALKSKDDEMNQLEDTILNALMSNLSTQMLSRSSGTVSSYAQEARNLIDLSNKLAAFKETPEAAEVDLTEYEATIKNKLDYLPTKKPTSGILKGYGTRYHPIYGYRHFHPAVDMTTSSGTPIVAAGAGTVTTAGYGRSQGNYIVINHGNGFTTTYMHCSKLKVSAGEKVEKGELIGLVGSTGTATGPHLHFEIRLYGEPLNPVNMIMQ